MAVSIGIQDPTNPPLSLRMDSSARFDWADCCGTRHMLIADKAVAVGLGADVTGLLRQVQLLSGQTPGGAAHIVKILYCFGIFITYALQFYVPADILVPPAVARVSGVRCKKAVDLLVRTALVILTSGFSATDDNESITFDPAEHMKPRSSALETRHRPKGIGLRASAEGHLTKQGLALSLHRHRPKGIGRRASAEGHRPKGIGLRASAKGHRPKGI
ncbi:hypothetical protein JZ751_005791 [Albula glossodonta]|uniref:Uncharacterized protein n=1 Tax=Albula glossodonta TaxID=121402 RepID=A0A8T2MM97_9TELE|nr:hypothetical protein JZ751_005791 [Albula glossodonta]